MSTRLPLLPDSALALSLLIVVLCGVLVLFVLNEAFGWSFGGLVIPGYLASVFVVSPQAGTTVIIEAALTGLVVAALSDGLGRAGLWTPFFGRERFLFVVLVSILVRQASEVWLLPSALAALEAELGLSWIHPEEAHSVGLVLVPLLANALSRGGFAMGVRQLLLPTLLAYLLLDDVLLQGTNLSLASMTLTYEDVALDFLHSARAYFVLASGAFVATMLNGRLAWSAGGILVPALLGLAWYEPARIAATMIEAATLAFAYRAITRLPVVRHWNLEGARKLAILFTLATLLRVGVGWAHDAGMPIDPAAWAGLGYILSALVAQRILQFGSSSIVLLPAAATSLAAFVGGSAAAWSVEQVFPSPPVAAQRDVADATPRLLATPEGVVEYARLRVRLDPQRSPSPDLRAASLSRWRAFWADVASGTTELRAPAGLTLSAAHGPWSGRSWLVLRESQANLDLTEGWGVALIRPGAPGPAVLVERPWSEPDIARGALADCVASDCVAVVFAGQEMRGGRDDARAAFLRAWPRQLARPEPGPRPAVGAPLPPARAGDLIFDALAEPPATWVAAEIDGEYLTETLVPALVRWRDGGLPAADVGNLAAVVGMRAALDEACGPCLVLTPVESGPIVVVRAGTHTPMTVEVPHPHREVGTARIGLGAFGATGATALLLDLAEPPLSLPARNDPLHALHLGWRRALAAEDPTNAVTWVVRGLAAPELASAPRPEEDLVVGVGRPVFDAPPAAVGALASNGRFGGVWSFRWAAAEADERGLAGNHIPSAQVDLQLGGVTPAVLWLSDHARDAWRAEAHDATAEWVAAAGLALEEGSADEAWDAGTGRATVPPGSFESLASLARRAAHQHNLNLLRALVDRGGPGVRVAWDASLQLAYVEVRTHGAVQRAFIARGDGREARMPLRASREDIRAALGWLPADLRIEGGAR